MAPRKTTTNQRRYTHQDVYRIAIVQLLLHSRGHSIAEVRAKLETMNMTDKGVEQQLSLLNGNHDEDPGPAKADPVARPTPGRDAARTTSPAAATDSGSSFLAERERLNAEVTRLRAQFAQVREEHKDAMKKLALYSTALAKIRKTSLKGVEGLVRILDEKG